MTLGAKNSDIETHMDQLFSHILKEQQHFQKVKGPDEDKKDLVKKELEAYTPYRGRGFFFNYFSSGRGHGPFSEMIDGSIKYDLIGGIGPNLLGHSHPLYIKAALESATVDTMMCGNLQTYHAPRNLTKTLMDYVKPNSKLRHFWFSGSGSFANDVALKILWQKMAPRYNVIAFTKAFAGRSVATQDITYNEAYRKGMPQLINVHHVPHFDQNNPEGSAKETIKALDELWEKMPDSFCAMTMELIQGEGGFIYGPRDYYVEVFEWAKKKGIYIWIDEVQTFGRTRDLFAFQMFDLGDYVDIVTVGKVLQACGTLYSEELCPQPGLIAGTFNGAIAALLAGEKAVRLLTEGPYYGEKGRITEIESLFFQGFEKLRQGSCQNKLGYYGGIGTMLSFEVGDSSKEVSINFCKKLFENGVISFIAGENPTRIRFLLPICLKNDHIDEIFQIIEKTVQEVI